MINTETRTILDANILEIRSENDPVIEGYAAVFNQRTEIFGLFTESIAPGAFKNTLKVKPDVRALFNHDPSQLLGRTKAGTVILREDSKGLWTETSPSLDTSVGKNVVEWLRRGELDGMSFAFTVKKQEWTFSDGKAKGMDHREILEVGELYDIGPVTYPAYRSTEVKVRKEAEAVHNEVRQRFEKNREQRGAVIQVPAGFDMIECRFGDSWRPELRNDEGDEPKETEANEKTENINVEVEIETTGNVSKPDAKENEPPVGTKEEAPGENENKPSGEEGDTPNTEQHFARRNPEILSREIEVSRGLAKARGII
jgi:hypothetical protein